MLTGALEQGLIYALLALGVYISFRILNAPDLTADGSFTLGLAVSAMVTAAGYPALGIAAAAVAGAIAGVVTALLQTKLNIHPILAGVLTMFGLYSINLAIMGNSPNVSLLTFGTLFTRLTALLGNKQAAQMIIPALFCAAVFAALSWFIRTHAGLCLRATGDNEDMVRASSINVHAVKITGLAISNACVAVCGAVMAQYQRYADINSGIGIMVIGLASCIIGEVMFGRKSAVIGFLSAICGAVGYRLIIALALRSEFVPAHMLRLASAAIVTLALSIPVIKARFGGKRAGESA